MADNHTASISIKHGKNTQGYFSFTQPKSLIVFVHGFGGNAITTWNNFPDYIMEDSQFNKADIIFYGYNTFDGQVGDHAAELYEFLLKMEKPRKSRILPANQKLPEREYKKIILVAHSLGAILVRQALLIAYSSKAKWVKNTSMALFAPAHSGAMIVTLAFSALPGLGGILAALVKFRYPILDNLNPNSSIIKMIKQQTFALQQSPKGDFTKAKLVVFAKGDKIVDSTPYFGDTAPTVVSGVNHTSVCKPRFRYQLPFEELVKLIK